ncbi:hypothetical protein EDB81DRAFT_698208 [Dactylonectria macrodidyma]|uniref:Rhodopsin domain-containing protein n=1 Tax=Dactylonectria macrodidyma TaxID=307937 RepID=A0A9P9DVG6_9HYPO|nr:hypothetical protein EDB81DRAFT_698208 [Dactylonectria macrodidyma]
MRNDVPNIIASVAVTFPLATLAVSLRLVSRRITTAGYGYDDIFAAVGWLGSVAFMTDGLVWISHGLGRPMEYGLTTDWTWQDKQRLGWKLLWVSSMTYTFAIAFCKFAILAFYWRIFQHSDIRIPIQVLSTLAGAWFFLRLFMVSLQCIPISALWNETGQARDRRCHIHESTFFFATVLTHVLLECAILALPAIEVSKLHLPRGQKVAVIMLFMFGVMTCLASVFVLIESFRFKSDSKEMTLQMALHFAWAMAECNLAVIAASLPMLRAVARKVMPGSFLTSNSGQSNSNQNSAPFSNGIMLAGVTRQKHPDADRSSSTNGVPHPKAVPSGFKAGRGLCATQTILLNSSRVDTPLRDFEVYERIHER